MGNRRCFVISPIGAEGSPERRHADQVFKHIIRPAAAECGFEAARSDHMTEPGLISRQVVDRILGDDFCIAVLTGSNPNVFYELAFAHASGRPVILLLERGRPAPFDLQDMRHVVYDFDPDAIADGTYANEIAAHIRALEAMGWQAPSPLESTSRPTVEPTAENLFYTLDDRPECSFPRITQEATSVSVLGRTIVNLLGQYQREFSDLMAKGCEVRLLFASPSSTASEFVYGDDRGDVYLQNLQIAQMHLARLKKSGSGSIEARTMSHIPTFGLVICEYADPTRNVARLQLYFLHACLGRDRPIIPIYRRDRWYDVVVDEFSRLWASAQDWTEPS